MPLSVRNFLKRLKRCELGTPARDILHEVTPADFSSEEDLAWHLVEQGRITAWQARRILANDLHAFTFGRFILQEPLGRGASGFVFRAVDEAGRTRVLKILNPAIASDPNALERFRREVRATMSLRHPNIVTATETGSARGLHFIAFEYHAGCDLKQFLVDGRMTPSIAATVVRQIAEALQHVSDANMVHRDVKPSNIHVAADGTARLLDLGLARLQQASSEQTVTQTGQILGTVDYISPEQAQDSRLVDIRSDIYSLGCALYECLAGHVPYPDGAVAEKLVKHLTATPAELPASVPRPLADIATRAMQRDPGDRYQQPRELAAAIEPFCEASVWPAPTQTATRTASVPIGLASTIPLEANRALDLELPFADSRPISRRWLPWVLGAIAAVTVTVGFLLSQPTVGSVSIVIAPQYPTNAIVLVDGAPTTANVVSLGPGTHTLRIDAEGYETYEERFKVLSGIQTDLSPKLTPTQAFAREAELAELRALVDSLRDHDAVDSDINSAQRTIREFARESPTDSTSLNALRLLGRLASHPDRYRHEDISDIDRKAAQWGSPPHAEPDELVAVFNSGRQHDAHTINCVQFLSDGRLASGDEAGRITIWKNGIAIRSERMISHGVKQMAEAGNNLFLVGHYGEVRFCEGPNFTTSRFLDSIEDQGTTAFSPPYHQTRRVTAAASNDGKRVATSADNLLFLWDPSGKSIARRKLPAPVVSSCFSRDFLICAVPQREILLLNPNTLETIERIEVDYPVLSMTICNQDTLGLGTAGGSMELWNLKTRKRTFGSDPNDLPVTAATTAADGGHILAAYGPTTVDTMDVIAPLRGFGFAVWQNRYSRQPAEVTSIDVSPDNSILALAGSRFVELYDTKSGRIHDWSANMPGAMTDVACLPDGTGFAATCDSLGVLRHSLADRSQSSETLELSRKPVSIAANPIGPMFAVGTTSEGGLIAANETTSLRATTPFGQGQSAWSPDGRWVVFAGEKYGVTRMRASDFSKAVQLHPLKDVVDVVFSPDSREYAAITQTGEIQVFGIDQKQPLRSLPGVGVRSFSRLAWSPNGKHLVCCRGENVVILAAGSLQQLATLPTAAATGDRRYSVAFRPDGDEVAVADPTRKITTWDLSSFPATATRDPIQVAPYVNSLCYTPEGRHLLTANSDGTVYVLRLRERLE